MDNNSVDLFIFQQVLGVEENLIGRRVQGPGLSVTSGPRSGARPLDLVTEMSLIPKSSDIFFNLRYIFFNFKNF